MSRQIAEAVVESFDRMDPTNSREQRPSVRMRRKPLVWQEIAGWFVVAVMFFVALAVAAR